MISRLRAPIFYGWKMVAAGFGLQLLGAALLLQSYGAYVVLLRQEFGWSKTALSAAQSLQQLENGLMGPIQGWIIDRFGPRAVIQIGIIIFGVGFILLSFVQSLAAFYAVFVVIAIGNSLSGFFSVNVAVVQWFERKRARALSSMAIGFAAGGLVVPLVAFSLDHYGWRPTALISGILIIVIGLPLSRVMRRRPEEYGEVVDGERPDPVATSATSASAAVADMDPTRDFTAREAIRTSAFWFISLGHGSALLIVSAVLVHVVSHLTEELGYSLAAASAVITVMTLCQVLGMVIGSVIGDRFDKRFVSFGCMAMHAVGLLLIAYAFMLPMVLAFAALHGIAWGLRGPMMQAIRADYFGRTSFGLIMGFSSMIFVFGNIAGPLVAGVLYDTTGSYRVGFTVLAVLAALGSVFFLLARRPPRPLREPADSTGAAVASRDA